MGRRMDEIDDRLAKIASQHAILLSGLPKDKQNEAIEGYRRLFLSDALKAGSTQDAAQQFAETVVAAIRILLQAIEITGGSDGGSA